MVIAKNGELRIKAGRAATKVVAAYNALDKEKADYICNGVDDQVEIQAAIDALPASGGFVYLTEGLFNVSAGCVVRAKLRLSGSGKYSTKLKLIDNANLNGKLIGYPAGGADNVHVSDFEIDGNSGNQSAGGQYDGVGLHGCYCKVDQMYIHECLSAGGFGYGIVFYDNDNKHNTVSANRIEDVDRDGIMFRSSGCDQNHIENNSAIWTKSTIYNTALRQYFGLEIQGDRNIIKNNYFDIGNAYAAGQQPMGIVNMGSYNRYETNIVENTVGEPFYGQGDHTLIKNCVFMHGMSSIGYVTAGPYSVFESNWCYDMPHGIIVNDHSVVKNNVLWGLPSPSGVRMNFGVSAYGSDIIIKDNLIYDIYQRGIFINGSRSNILIEGNRLYKESWNMVGIWADGTLSNVIAQNNIFDVNTVLDAGALAQIIFIESKMGVEIFSGDAAAKDFLGSAHGLVREDPDKTTVTVSPVSADAKAASPVSGEIDAGDNAKVRIRFSTAPANGTNNVEIIWNARTI